MGNIQSGVEELVSDFSNMKIVERLLNREEIKQAEKRWYAMYPQGFATRETLTKYTDKFDTNMSHDVVEIIFNAMDKNNDGIVTFSEYLYFKAIMMKEHIVPVEYVVELLFMMYDSDNSGYITRNELEEGINAMRKVNGCPVSTQIFKSNQEVLLGHLMKAMDMDQNGRISKVELLQACRHNPHIINQLKGK